MRLCFKIFTASPQKGCKFCVYNSTSFTEIGKEHPSLQRRSNQSAGQWHERRWEPLTWEPIKFRCKRVRRGNKPLKISMRVWMDSPSLPALSDLSRLRPLHPNFTSLMQDKWLPSPLHWWDDPTWTKVLIPLSVPLTVSSSAAVISTLKQLKLNFGVRGERKGPTTFCCHSTSWDQTYV